MGLAQDFQTSDLEGTWCAYLSETNPLVGSYWIYGSYTVDDSGNITGGSYTAPDGTTVKITGGTGSLDSDGLMTGTIVIEDGTTGNLPSGKLDAGKTIIGLVASDARGSMDVGIAIKGGSPEDGKVNVEEFVTRFYQLCLDRDPDSAGLNGWVAALLAGTQTGSGVANGFVFSQEFTNKNTTDEEYITILYEAYF